MGIRIREFVDSLAGSGENVFAQMAKLRTLSVRISELYQNTVRETLEEIWKENTSGEKVCFRPVVADGDDITVMLSASDAFPFVRTFLTKLEKQHIAEFSESFKPTAAAGIAFVGLHFPFSVAYDMAEACCKNAKKETIHRCGGAEAFGKAPVSSFDYQLCVSNIPDDIGDYRQKHFVFTADGTEYRLLRRPYLFWDKEDYSAERFFKESDDLYSAMRDKNIARSKLKGLRNAYGAGVQEARRYTEYICAHAKTADELVAAERFRNGPFNEDHEAVFFDILDVMDIIRKEEQA